VIRLSLILALFVCCFALRTAQAVESCQHHSQEDIENSDIAVYRDNYVPVEYFPEHDLWRYADIAVMSILLIAGFVMVVRKSRSRNLIFAAAVAFIYFGIVRGGCICPVGAVANMSVGLKNPNMIGRTTLAIFLIPLVSAWLFGRVFCTTACPLGAVQHLLYSRKRFIRLPRLFVKISLFTTVAVLLATVFFAVSNRMFLICELDPYRVLFFNGYAWFRQLTGFIMHTPQPEHLILLACSGGLLVYTAVMLVIG
jgi:hypothetical protein